MKRTGSLSVADPTQEERPRIAPAVPGIDHDSPLEEAFASPEIYTAPKNPQACLDALPEELIVLVCEHLSTVSQDPYSFKALDNFSRTSKRFKRVADEHLYHAVVSDDHKKMESIANNTELAKNILHIYATMEMCANLDNESRNGTRIRAITNAVNLQALDMTTICKMFSRYQLPVMTQHNWLQAVHEAVAGASAQTFANLEELTIDTNIFAVSILDVVIRMPSLEVLQLMYVYQTSPIGAWKVPQSSSGIKTLELVQCHVDSGAILQLISGIKALQNFHYSHTGMRNYHHESLSRPNFSWATIGDALRAQSHSLRNAYLLNYVEDVEGDANPTRTTLGSLRACTELRKLRVGLHAIIDSKFDNDSLAAYLPANLSCFSTWTKRDRICIQYCATAIASLKDVLVTGSSRHFNWTMDKGSPDSKLRISGAVKTLVDAGIKVKINIAKEYAGISEIMIDELRGRVADDYEDSARDGFEPDSNSEEEEEDEASTDSDEEEEEAVEIDGERMNEVVSADDYNGDVDDDQTPLPVTSTTV